ncbi:MAG: Ig-like domain-containing protein [Lachnospiraceae bacterium]|nr:Ig-like domain-containing protein [Lachnospiraceae bacterium]
MKKKISALLAAIMLVTVSTGNAVAGDIIIDETVPEELQAEDGEYSDLTDNNSFQIDAMDEIVIPDQTEAAIASGTTENTDVPGLDEAATENTAMPETEEAATADGEVSLYEESEILLGIEKVDTAENIPETEFGIELMQTGEEQVQESGYASCAVFPKMRAYLAGSYTDSYGAQLSENARGIYNAMKAAYVDSRKAVGNEPTLSITLTSALDFQDAAGLEQAKELVRHSMQSAYDAFIYDFPEVFWMGAPTYSYIFSGNTYPSSILGITLKPGMIYAGAGSQVPAFDAAVSSAYANAMNGQDTSTRQGQVKAIHDYLCGLLNYSEGTTEKEKAYAHSAAGVFLSNTKNVVCEGYAKAFKILCKKAGIESVLIVGYANGPHMWNYVRMENGNWYMVDVTWDDIKKQTSGTTYLLAGSTSVGYTGSTIGAERTVYSNFTGSSYSQSFAVPVLSPVEYSGEANQGHRHIWNTVTVDATCTTEGYSAATCECGARTIQYFEALGHCFDKKTYVYNNDATCTEDGTMTLVCDYCGTAADMNTAPGIDVSLYKVQAPGTAKGHRYDSYVSNQDADWYKNGTKTAVCENGCGTRNTVQDSGSAKIPTISLNAASLVLKTGQSTTALKVSNLAEGDRVVSWSSANTKIVRVNSKTGKITAQKKTGKTKITITLQSGLTKSITVKVQSSAVRTTKISGVSKKMTIQKGKKAKLTPVITPITSKEKLTYSSSNKKVATVSAKGVITAKSSGKAKITVKSGGRKITVTVTVPKVTATKITGVSQSITLKRGKSKTLKPGLSPAGSEDTIKYTSSNRAVATVSSRGKITAKKRGTAVITLKAGKAVAKCEVTVK